MLLKRKCCSISGQQRGRFRTSNITKDPRTSCYQTTLLIKDVLPMDSMMYYFSMENDRGKARFGVRLMVRFSCVLKPLKHL